MPTLKRAAGARAALVAVLAVGTVAVMVARSDRVPAVRTVALDGLPRDVTFDPVSGHAFISTYNLDPQTGLLASDAHMDVLDVRSGALVRTIDIGSSDQSTIVDRRTGRLVVAENGVVVVLDTHRGRVVRTTTLTPSLGPLALDERRGRAYVPQSTIGTPAASLNVLDTHSGALLRQTTVGGDPNLDTVSPGDAVVDQVAGRVFFSYSTTHLSTSVTDSVAMLDANGHLLRTTTIGHYVGQVINAPALAADPRLGRVLVFDMNTGSITTLDARTGATVRMLHVATSGAPWPGTPAVTFGPRGIDVQTGRTFVSTGRRYVCSPSGGCRPVGPPGQLYMLDTRTGRLLRRLLPGVDPAAVAVDAKARWVLVQSPSPTGSSETLRLLDAGSGAVLRRIGLGRDGYSLLDDQTGHVYIANSRGTITAVQSRTARLGASVTVGLAATNIEGHTMVSIIDGRVIVLRVHPTSAPPPDPMGWMPQWLHHWLPWKLAGPRLVPASVSTFDAPH